MRGLVSVILLCLAAVALVSEALTFRVVGYTPIRDPSATELDAIPHMRDSLAAKFLSARNTIQLDVPRDMAAGEFLTLYHIDFRHVRRQLEDQLGVQKLLDNYLLRKGTKFRITLMPPADSL